MALPVTISNVQFPNQNYYCGPFLSGGAFYVVLFDSTTAEIIEVHKATDPTSSFTEQDSANKPDTTFSQFALWAFQDGTDLHIVHSGSSSLAYSIFHMATDLWDGTIVDEEIEAITGVGGSSISCSIGFRSSDSIPIVLYNGNTDRVHGADRQRVDYARRTGGSWTVGIAVDNGGADDWFGSVIVPGSSDRMHFFFKNDDLDDGYQRTLLSDNSLEAFPSAGDTGTDGTVHIFGPGISYDDGGTQRVRCLYRQGAQNVSYAEFDSVDAPGAFTENLVSDADVHSINGSPVASLAADGTDEHLLYADTPQDLWHDKNDGLDIEILDGVTVNRLSSNVYDRTTHTRLAYVYDDGGTIKYNEVQLGALGADQLPALNRRISARNPLPPRAHYAA